METIMIGDEGQPKNNLRILVSNINPSWIENLVLFDLAISTHHR